jgi:biotin carboxyl carrier protein
MKYTVTIGDKAHEVEVGSDNSVVIDGERHTVDMRAVHGRAVYSLLLDNTSWEVAVEQHGDEYTVTVRDTQHLADVQDERSRKIGKGLGKGAGPSGEVVVKAPMPGLVRGVPVETWQEVKAGQGVIILEAMKMENELRAPRAGVISEIRVKPGDKVEQGQALVVIK